MWLDVWVWGTRLVPDWSLESGSLPGISHTLCVTAFSLLLKICLYCSLQCWSHDKYFKPICFVHCFLNWMETWKKYQNPQETKLSTQSPVLSCKRLPAWDGLLKPSTLAGSKCPLNVPPGTAARCFLILLEQHFPDNSYHTLSSLLMFAKWSQIGLTSPERNLYHQNLAEEKDRACSWPNGFPPASGEFLHWETFASQSWFFLHTEPILCKKHPEQHCIIMEKMSVFSSMQAVLKADKFTAALASAPLQVPPWFMAQRNSESELI